VRVRSEVLEVDWRSEKSRKSGSTLPFRSSYIEKIFLNSPKASLRQTRTQAFSLSFSSSPPSSVVDSPPSSLSTSVTPTSLASRIPAFAILTLVTVIEARGASGDSSGS